MLDATVDAARARGEPALSLNVLKTNAAARRFYARRGFFVVGERAFSTDLREIDMFAMRRELSRH